MRTKKQTGIQKTVYTYNYLWVTGHNALLQAKTTELGSFYNLITTMLFSAFCLEAYFNHVGEQKIQSWDLIEKCLQPIKKLELLSRTIGLKVDKSCRPFQTIDDIFKFRNIMVHGKTEQVEFNNEQNLLDGEDPVFPEITWKKWITLENAQRFLDDAEKMVVEIHKAAKMRGHPFTVMESSITGAG